MTMALCFLLGFTMAHAPVWVIAFAGGLFGFFSPDVERWIQR
jgi:hypothetical protein